MTKLVFLVFSIFFFQIYLLILAGPRTGVPRTIGQVALTQLAQEEPRTVGPKDYWALGLLAPSTLVPKDYWAAPVVLPNLMKNSHKSSSWLRKKTDHGRTDGQTL